MTLSRGCPRGGPRAGCAVLIGLLVVLATPSPARAIWPFSPSRPSSPSTKEPAATAPEAPASTITAPEVARRAEEASKALRDIDALLTPGPGITSIQERLPDIQTRLTAQIEQANRQLEDGLSTAALDTLLAQWQVARAELATYVNVLAERGTTLERSLASLTRLRDTWTQARTDVRASKAPQQVVERIDGILNGIATSRTRLSQERGATLVLQDQVARLVGQCDEVLVRLAAARTDMAGRLVVRDGVPLWHVGELASSITELPGHLRQAVGSVGREVAQFVAARRSRLSVNLVLIAVLAALTWAARRAARRLTDALEERAIRVLDHPIAAALLLGFLASAFSPARSRVAQGIVELILVAPTLLVLRSGIDPRRASALYWLAAPVVADIVRRLCSTVPVLEQEIFVLEALGVMVLLAWKLAFHRPRWVLMASGRWDRLIPYAVAGALVAFTAAFVAAVAGYVRLAIFIGSGILGSTYVALVLYGSAKVAAALISLTMCVRPLSGLRIVEHHRPRLERRVLGMLRWIAGGAWVILVLRHFGLWTATIDVLDAVLSAEWRLGSLTVPVAGVVVFLVTVAATFTISSILRFLLREEIYPRIAPARELPFAVLTLVHYSLLLCGFLLGLAALGVDLTKITIVAGALGVGVGFGLQNLVNNFVSGLVVLSERRINVGDAVQIGQVEGVVQQLGIRACTVRTWEGAEVIVPNASLVSENVANWTLSDNRRRIDVPVTVAYGTVPEKVSEVLLGVARLHPELMTVPAPIVVFLGFGDSALRFELRVWTNKFARWFMIRSELSIACYAALRDNQIEIPFPHYDVRVHQV